MFTCVNCKKSLYNSVIGVGICNGCCAVELPFFATSNIEFELLTNNKWADLGSRYDEYHLPQKLANKSLHASPNDFFLLHFNVRSISKNKEKIDEFLHDFERLPDLVAISETKLNENSTSNISIPNYCFLRNDSPSNAGGVGLCIKESFKFRIRKELSLNISNCEDLWIEIETNQPNKSFVCAVVYRYPNKNIQAFQNKLCDTLLSLENEKISCIVCGDMNVNFSDKKSKIIREYTNSLNSVGYLSLIDIPTRFSDTGVSKPSILDLIYTNVNKSRTKSGVCIYDISDHFPIFFIPERSKLSSKTGKKLTRCTKSFNLENFLFDLNYQLSTNMFDSKTSRVDNDVKCLNDTFIAVLDKHAPLRIMTRKEMKLNSKPWITKVLLTSIKTKNKLFRNYVKNYNQENKMNYKKHLNKLTHIKNLAKRMYYEKQIKENHQDSSKTWKIIKEIINYQQSSRKSNLPSTITIDGQNYNASSKSFLNKLCEFFANIGANMISKNNQASSHQINIYNKRCMQSFVMHEISEDEVRTSINNVKAHTAHGFDHIPAKFIKTAACVLTPFLTRIFNKSVEQETFPKDYKIAYVVPIPKVSSPHTFGDFRPISLLPIFSKLFEKIIEIWMRNFLNKNDILTASQYGFKTNSSTELAITTLYDKLLDNLNNKKTTCSIFLDLKKAFNSVSHDILLKKLEHYGFRGSVWKLLNSYLKDSKICTKVDNSIFKLHSVKFGVPQGSVLGSLFFLALCKRFARSITL